MALPTLDALYAKLPGERPKTYQARQDFYRVGPGRTLPILLDRYVERLQDSGIEPPTTSLGTLQSWSARDGWQESAELYDRIIQKREDDEAAALRKQVLVQGFAYDLNRIKALNKLALKLEELLYEEDGEGILGNLWLQDVKSVGAGEFTEIHEIRRFNSSLISQLRGALDDLAKETGGRQQHIEVGTPENTVMTLMVVKGVSFDDI